MRFAREFAERHAFIAVFFLLVVLSAICYHKTLSNGFVQDDIPSIVENPAASTPIDIAAVFTKNAWGDRPGFAHIPNYRPLTTLTYALTEAAAGQEPFAFHLVNLFLHALVAFLLFIFALELFNLRIPALIGAALFAVHPLASEAVCGAVNREELLCAVFSLAGLLVFLKAGSVGMTFSRFAAVSGCFALALLSKENAVTFPLAVLMTDLFLWINRGKDSIRGKDSAPTDYCRRRILSPNLKRIASYLS
ncbi:MAG: glycosyltransferase family 39 protein, partial [Deltaproteobacteria bacterium]|nr:glycosyltransferase family 39 protein [Deltaproteobacteria bacterium]